MERDQLKQLLRQVRSKRVGVDAALERLADAPGLLGPYRGDLEQDLANLPILLAGIREQLERSGLEGWQRPWKALERQLTQYYAWVRADILPRARTDHRLPDEVYADNLFEGEIFSASEEKQFTDRSLVVRAVKDRVGADAKITSQAERIGRVPFRRLHDCPHFALRAN